MALTLQYKIDHCRGELGRGKIYRCPKSWLREAHLWAVENKDDALRTACVLALNAYDRPTHGTVTEIQRLIRPRLYRQSRS